VSALLIGGQNIDRVFHDGLHLVQTGTARGQYADVLVLLN
jgi:hypothetical protein